MSANHCRGIIIEQAWNHAFDGLTDIVDVYVARVRRKFGAGVKFIRTVRGSGNMLQNEEENLRSTRPNNNLTCERLVEAVILSRKAKPITLFARRVFNHKRIGRIFPDQGVE